jgi:hypothetical protein
VPDGSDGARRHALRRRLINPLHELVLVGLGMPILDNLTSTQSPALLGRATAGPSCSSMPLSLGGTARR